MLQMNQNYEPEFIPIFSSYIDHGFLFHYLLTDYVTEYAKSISTGSSNSQKRITADAFMEIDIAIPCLEEQKKIADFLSTLDERIECQRKVVESCKLMKKGFLQQMFPN